MDKHYKLINDSYPKIQTEVSIAASHIVHTADADSPCRFLHGHNWKFVIEIQGMVQKDSMVVDFRILKKIITRLDHKTIIPKCIADIRNIATQSPRVIFKSHGLMYDLPAESVFIIDIPAITAEELVKWAITQFTNIEGLVWSSISVTVFESEKSSATLRIR